MAIHQNGNAVACAIDYEMFTVGNIEEKSVEYLWAELGKRLRKYHKNHDCKIYQFAKAVLVNK